jgi:hypothetical protein
VSNRPYAITNNHLKFNKKLSKKQKWKAFLTMWSRLVSSSHFVLVYQEEKGKLQ